MRFVTRRGSLGLSLLALVGGASLWAPRAQATSDPAASSLSSQALSGAAELDVKQNLRNILNSMGVKISSEGSESISVISKNNTYQFALSKDKTIIFVNVWWNVPKNKIDKMPWKQMLEWNSTHYTYFGMEKNDDGSVIATMTLNFTAKGIDAALVRDRLDTIEQDSDAETSLFDTAKWK